MAQEWGTYRVIGRLIGANMNTTADQAIAISATKYLIPRILVTNASTSLTLAAGGFYPAASKGGTPLVAAIQAYSGLTGSTLAIDLTMAGLLTVFTQSTLYFALTTGQGGAATADIHLLGFDLTP